MAKIIEKYLDGPPLLRARSNVGQRMKAALFFAQLPFLGSVFQTQVFQKSAAKGIPIERW